VRERAGGLLALEMKIERSGVGGSRWLLAGVVCLGPRLESKFFNL
jgi:hypothetical protein